MRSGLALLGLLAATLMGSIVLRLSAPETADVADLAAPRRPPLVAAVAGIRGDEADAARRILARPLFNPDRRPVPGAAGAAAAGPASPPRLAGILVTPDGRKAIFAVDNRSVVVREGGRIGGFLVTRIADAEVTVAGLAGPLSLRPSYTPADSAASAGRPSAAGTEAGFNANPAPSGLDILRNAARQASPAAAGQTSSPSAAAGQTSAPPVPGQEQTGIGGGPPAVPAQIGPLALPPVVLSPVPRLVVPESIPSR